MCIYVKGSIPPEKRNLRVKSRHTEGWITKSSVITGLEIYGEKFIQSIKEKKTENTLLKYRVTEELETIKLNACGLNPIYLNDWWTAQENKCVSESCLITKDGGIGCIYPHFIKNGASPTLEDFP